MLGLLEIGRVSRLAVTAAQLAHDRRIESKIGQVPRSSVSDAEKVQSNKDMTTLVEKNTFTSRWSNLLMRWLVKIDVHNW